MAKKVFNKEDEQKSRQPKGFQGGSKSASSKNAKPSGGVGAKMRGFWQRLFK
jgi:hypothetical protein